MGLVAVEVAVKMLPKTGESWRALRHGDFSEIQLHTIPCEFSSLIESMLNADPHSRPNIEEIIANPYISSSLRHRNAKTFEYKLCRSV